jgi:enoyl-CoA hydratase/carnithine racemase
MQAPRSGCLTYRSKSSPGVGGTQRLPRFIDLQKVLMMMRTSQPVGKEEVTLKLGFVDGVVPQGQPLSYSKHLHACRH